MRGRDDADLLVRLRRRDPESVGLLYDRYGKAAYSLAFKILRDPVLAENAVAEAVLKCWNRVTAFRETRGGALGIWLLATTYTNALEYRRGEEPRATESAVLFNDWSKTLDTDRVQESCARLQRLTGEEKLVLELAFFEGLTPAELVAGLGQTRAEVDHLIQTALGKLTPVEHA